MIARIDSMNGFFNKKILMLLILSLGLLTFLYISFRPVNLDERFNQVSIGDSQERVKGIMGERHFKKMPKVVGQKVFLDRWTKIDYKLSSSFPFVKKESRGRDIIYMVYHNRKLIGKWKGYGFQEYAEKLLKQL